MNMWGLSRSSLIFWRKALLNSFLHRKREMKRRVPPSDLHHELLHAGKAEVKVLPTDAEWFGVTYQEDKASVTEAFRKLIADGVYSEKLYD